MADLSVSQSALLNAYRDNQSQLRNIGGLGVEVSDQIQPLRNFSDEAPGTFLSLVRDRLLDVRDSLAVAENTSERGLAGDASVDQVVLALSEAEGSLRSMLAIRDRIIGAYQEILRTPI